MADSFHLLTRHDGQGILKIRGSLRYQSGGWIDGPVYRTKYILFSASGYRDIVGIVFCSGTNPGRVNRCRRANAAYEAKEYPYYVEFRVAVDGVYGHSYIAYGRLGPLGRPVTATYADIHPTGDFPSMVLGHFFSMEAATIPEKDTLGYKIASRFRQLLTAAEYRRLNLVIVHIRAVHHSWSVLAYNCNDFVADVARGMGMQTPATLSLPYDFIPRLQAINERTLRPTPLPASAPVTEIRQSGSLAGLSAAFGNSH